jgi:hypothetical protein
MDQVGTNTHNEPYQWGIELISRLNPAHQNAMLDCAKQYEFLMSIYHEMSIYRPFKRGHVRTLNRYIWAISDSMRDVGDIAETIEIAERNLSRMSRIINLYRMPPKFNGVKK